MCSCGHCDCVLFYYMVANAPNSLFQAIDSIYNLSKLCQTKRTKNETRDVQLQNKIYGIRLKM